MNQSQRRRSNDAITADEPSENEHEKVGFISRSNDVEQIEWSKIQTPTDVVMVPYYTLAPLLKAVATHRWVEKADNNEEAAAHSFQRTCCRYNHCRCRYISIWFASLFAA